ncbi:DUF3892 domain-containing protein [Microbacterium sp. CFBP 8790]|uniref:DUF3892 domain-containing protein n=1 Tax=unclassified Microbacterium TaxID=2609290 RepID=UPI001781CBB0|nr:MULTISPECIES: DUF3892 domain-containing protein [unclassified Microbacterium]MBD8207878.1 DUF3892 domain-containing protein [Microbacterium sp. CFBP 8801]MBD8510780.1 DUF3892 domain-containing protein [Microbacterium sp. CFBP 8790]
MAPPKTARRKIGVDGSPRSTADAIRDIESRAHTYFVQWPEKRTEVRIVQGATGKYLRTDRDSTTRNNLDYLPNL